VKELVSQSEEIIRMSKLDDEIQSEDFSKKKASQIFANDMDILQASKRLVASSSKS
jgi:hypothetical protein